MLEAKKIVIDLVTWNGLAYLPNFFSSLDEQTLKDFTITVVDNASDDGTIKWLTENRPDAAVLRNFRNQGFSRAHNQAVTLALSRWPEEAWPERYIVVANQDMEFAPGCLEQLLRAMEADSSLAACGPKVLRAYVAGDYDGRRETERTDIIDTTGLAVTRARRFFDRGAGEQDRGLYDSATEVFGLSGTCIMFRASALAQAKLNGEFFDEDFYMYKEDADLAWRMRRLGMKVRFVPGAVVWHHRSAPSGRQGWLWLRAFMRRFGKPARINYQSTRNHVWLAWKNDECANRLLHAPWIVPYELGKLAVAWTSWATLRGYAAALAGLPKMWKKRRELRRRAKASGRDMRKWFV